MILTVKPDILSILLSHITINYLSNLFSTCIISNTSDKIKITLNELNSNSYNLNLNNNSINDGNNIYAQLIWMKYNRKIENLDIIVQSGINAGCQAFIIGQSISIKFLDSFLKVRDDCKQRLLNTHVVFVPVGKFDGHSDIVNSILRHSTIYDIPNILIISPSSIHNNGNNNINYYYNNNSFDLITSQFVGRFNTTSSILLDRLYYENISFRNNVNLFPDKLSNLQQRIVKLAIFNYKPYTIWEEVPSGYGNANTLNATNEKTLLIDGTETLMFLEFCVKYNCTWEISLDEKGEWGEIFDNHTGNGVLGAVYERRADVGVGALYTWYNVYLHLSMSKPISRSGITCIVPSPELLAGWLMPALPFTGNLWLAVFVSIIVGVLSLRLLRITKKKTTFDEGHIIQNESITETILLVSGIYLMQSANIVTKHLPEIFILGCILLIGMMIANAYGGGLASLMTIPQYEEPIDTAHQLAEHKLEWGATHDAWIFSIQSATQSDLVTLVSMFRTPSTEILQKRSTKKDFAFSIERLPFGHFAIGEYVTEESLDYLQIMIDDIYWEYCVAMSSKTWPLLSNFDDLVLRVAQSGIQYFWELQVVMKHANNKIQLGVAASRGNHHDSEGPVRLRPSHLLGVYVFWVIGLLGSIIAFIIELFWYRHKHKRNKYALN